MQQREREEKEKPVKSKTRPDRAVQVSWTNRLGKAWAQVHEPPPKARPNASPEPDQEAVPKQAPKPAAEMMVIDDDDSWGEWPKVKNWSKKERKRGRQREAEAEQRRLQELRDKRIAQELEDEQALDTSATGHLHDISSSNPNSHWHCSICKSEVEVGEFLVVPPCFHRFHQSCALTWFSEESMTCPTCRVPAEDYITVVRKPPEVPANDINEGDDMLLDEVADDSGMAGLPEASAAAMPPQSHAAKADERDRLAREHEQRLLDEKQNLLWQNDRIDQEMQKAIQESLKMQAASSSSSSSSAGVIPPVIAASVIEDATAEPEPTGTEPESTGRGGSEDAGEPEKADDESTIAGSEENEGVRKRIKGKRPSSQCPHYQ